MHRYTHMYVFIIESMHTHGTINLCVRHFLCARRSERSWTHAYIYIYTYN